MKNTYLIAGKVIEIDSVYAYVHKQCRDYLCSAEPDFSIKTAQPDIEAEKTAFIPGDDGRVISDEVFESTAVYRKIAEKIPFYGAFLFHGSAVSVDGKAYVFAAPSGTGKSTHTALWREIFADRAVMINDDKPIIGVDDSGIFVYGTPWDGKHHLSSNIDSPLKAICVIERDTDNSIIRLSSRDAMPLLMNQVYRPFSPDSLSNTLSLLDRVLESTGVYLLKCNTEREAALLSYNTMKEDI